MPLHRPILAVAALAVTACIPTTHAAPAGGMTRASSPLDSVAASAPRVPPGEAIAVVQAGTRVNGPSAADAARPVAGGGMLEAAPADATATPRVEEAVSALAMDVSAYEGRDRVEYYVKRFTGPAREYITTRLEAGSRYEPMIRSELEAGGLPGDMYYLALVESGFDPNAYSRAAAVGMWQFMTSTARDMGLRVDWWVDERRDPVRSTRAAVRFIRELRDQFGSLYLAAAAYNAGSGRVSRGLRRLPADDDEADSASADAMFFRLYDTKLLRRETKDYVPKLIAAALIAKEPARYGFTVTAAEPPSYDSIVVPTMTGLDVIARLADTTVAAIRELNPQYLRLATPPGVASVVRVPSGRGPATVAAYAELPPDRRVTFVEHFVARGETMGGIARRYHVSQRLLADANPKVRPSRLRVGQRLIVPTGGAISSSVARQMADPPKPAGTSRSGWHRVRRGETLTAIADDYGVTVRDLLRWNALHSSGRIRAGQKIRVVAPG